MSIFFLAALGAAAFGLAVAAVVTAEGTNGGEAWGTSFPVHNVPCEY